MGKISKSVPIFSHPFLFPTPTPPQIQDPNTALEYAMIWRDMLRDEYQHLDNLLQGKVSTKRRSWYAGFTIWRRVTSHLWIRIVKTTRWSIRSAEP